ncbi:MAG TPA: Crp/Fnr family transcriptional regulator, partial [Pyrinomonadaceae bacterium]|nr:Crp/Fnr family transcriptional regulator [Pyrinomonadaceae bacterium]
KDVRVRQHDSEGAARFTTRAAAINQPHTEVKSALFDGLPTNRLLARLPGADFARLLAYMQPVTLAAGNYLYGLDNKVDFIYFPETAVISHMHLLEDGNTTEVALIGREGMTGLSAIFDAQPANYWSQVIIGGSAVRMKVEVLQEDFSRAEVMQRLVLNYASERIGQLSQRAACNGRHTLLERLTTWLLMLHDRAGEGQMLLTHEEIARHLGARRATISVAATLLKDRHIISYNRGHLTILDRQGLLSFACECYETLARCHA